MEVEWHFQQLDCKIGWISVEKDTLRSAPALWPASSSKPAVIHEILCNAFKLYGKSRSYAWVSGCAKSTYRIKDRAATIRYLAAPNPLEIFFKNALRAASIGG